MSANVKIDTVSGDPVGGIGGHAAVDRAALDAVSPVADIGGEIPGQRPPTPVLIADDEEAPRVHIAAAAEAMALGLREG
ncbi:MAG: hypothetical protein ACKOD9_04450, partial [Rubrivivax sp.]